MAIHRTTDKRARGLAAALLTSDTPPWEFDIRAVEPGTDPVEVSDAAAWRSRQPTDRPRASSTRFAVSRNRMASDGPLGPAFDTDALIRPVSEEH